MKARDIIIALWIKNSGDWDKIYRDIRDKNIDDNLEDYIKGIDTECLVTILDEGYPDRLKTRVKPPFVL